MRGDTKRKSFRGPPLALYSNHVGHGPIATELAITEPLNVMKQVGGSLHLTC